MLLITICLGICISHNLVQVKYLTSNTDNYFTFIHNICNSYNTGKSALPDIYARCPRARSARGRVRIYQAKHECLCYN